MSLDSWLGQAPGSANLELGRPASRRDTASPELQDDSDKPKDIIEETKEYYRRRAGRYWDWDRRTGEYEGGPEPEESWFNDGKALLGALDSSRLEGDVLEVASGTGALTEALLKNASFVTALDASQEMLDRCKERLGSNPLVRYVLADFYEWVPDRAYDAVASSFWISHVPASKLDEFASKVSRCLGPEGKIFIADQQPGAMANEEFERPGGEVVRRVLAGEGEYRIYKHFYTPDEINECFMKNGIATKVTNTPVHFFYVTGQKSRS
jgi:2-polyprenyl-3-methyl-5-hydroxy-6-metoxy-1,4-benzoquinol methylase